MLKQVKDSYPGKDQAWYDHVVYESFYNLMLTLFEYSYFVFSPKRVLKHSVLKNQHYLDEALKEGKGTYIMAFHMGNGEMALFRTCLGGYKLNLIAKRIGVKILDSLIFESRELSGLKHIAPKNALDKILEVMNKNEIVVFVQDQFTYPPRGIPSTFIHQPAYTNPSLAIFAQKRGRQVIPANVYRDENDNTVVDFYPPLNFEEGMEVPDYVQKCNDWMTARVDERPEMWMWIHSRWKRQPK
jgi:Kdo2-lipid IVA lauroyltransferase/acyltransferase